MTHQKSPSCSQVVVVGVSLLYNALGLADVRDLGSQRRIILGRRSADTLAARRAPQTSLETRTGYDRLRRPSHEYAEG